jgi:hypothetical protein
MNYKISIVMGYINRKLQLTKTLETFKKSSHTNYEIIIVNDGDENLEDLTITYKNVKIFKNPIKYYNPCMTYNYGFQQATGDIIIIQNPEALHVGDILSQINNNLKENDCMVFNCYFLENYEQNKLLYQTKNLNDINEFIKNNKNIQWFPQYQNWSVHHILNKNIAYFCMTMFKSKLNKINYFTSSYKNGYCFDDDEFSRKIKLSHINVYFYSEKFNDDQTFVIHQHHDRQKQDYNALIRWNINKNIFIREHKKYIKSYLNYYNNENMIDFKNITINNTTKLKTLISEKEIYYTANIQQIILKENLNNVLNNSIFEFTCNVSNYNKTQIFMNNIQLNIINNTITYTGKIENLINDDLTFNSSINITNPILLLKQLNYKNQGTYIIDNQTWLYPNISKIAYTYINELNDNNFNAIKHFYNLNPDWYIYVYHNNSNNFNKEQFKNFEDIIIIELNITNVKNSFLNDYIFIKTFSENTGLWFNCDEAIIANSVLNKNYNYIYYHQNKYKNDLLISNNTDFYKYLLNNINDDFEGYDKLLKKLFNNVNEIKNKYNF